MRVVLHAAALVLNLMSASAAATAAANTWHVDPISVKIAHDRTTLFPSSATTIDIAAMKVRMLVLLLLVLVLLVLLLVPLLLVLTR